MSETEKQPYSPNAFWYSKISLFRECPRKFKIEHIDKVPRPSTKNGDLEFGSALHLGVNEIMNKGNGQEVFGLYMDSLKHDQVEYGRYDHDTLKMNGEMLLSKFERLHAKYYTPVEMEVRLFGKIGNHEFEGQPDFIGYYKDEPCIVDWKTTAYRYDPRRTQSDEQLPIYAHLAEQVKGFKATKVIHAPFVKDQKEPSIQKPVVVELTDTRKYNTLQNVAETCDDIVSRKTWPMNTSNCVKGSIICSNFQRCWGGKTSE